MQLSVYQNHKPASEVIKLFSYRIQLFVFSCYCFLLSFMIILNGKKLGAAHYECHKISFMRNGAFFIFYYQINQFIRENHYSLQNGSLWLDCSYSFAKDILVFSDKYSFCSWLNKLPFPDRCHITYCRIP